MKKLNWAFYAFPNMSAIDIIFRKLILINMFSIRRFEIVDVLDYRQHKTVIGYSYNTCLMRIVLWMVKFAYRDWHQTLLPTTEFCQVCLKTGAEQAHSISYVKMLLQPAYFLTHAYVCNNLILCMLYLAPKSTSSAIKHRNKL